MKLPHRRQILHLAAGAAALPVVSPIARAQTYPTRLITMIVPLADGGPTDVVARLLAERMRGMLGQPVIIENVTGAEGSIGIGRAAHATHRRLLVAPLSARKSSLREGPTGTALAP